MKTALGMRVWVIKVTHEHNNVNLKIEMMQ